MALPQVRGAGRPFPSTLMGFLDGNSEVLDRLVTEMYARGMSTRDIEDAFRDVTGGLLISRSAASEIRDLERHQLRLLRADLGLDPPPVATEADGQGGRRRHQTGRITAVHQDDVSAHVGGASSGRGS